MVLEGDQQGFKLKFDINSNKYLKLCPKNQSFLYLCGEDIHTSRVKNETLRSYSIRATAKIGCH